MYFVAIGSPAEETVGELCAGSRSHSVTGFNVHKTLLTLLIAALNLTPFGAQAFDLEESLKQLHEQYRMHETADIGIAQGGGMSLDQAIESVRRRGDVDRILSAETRREGNREVHHIRYLTKDGKVKTAKINGRSTG